jgi:hypothetical protein
MRKTSKSPPFSRASVCADGLTRNVMIMHGALTMKRRRKRRPYARSVSK